MILQSLEWECVRFCLVLWEGHPVGCDDGF